MKLVTNINNDLSEFIFVHKSAFVHAKTRRNCKDAKARLYFASLRNLCAFARTTITMKSQGITFPSGAATEYHFEATPEDLRHLAPPKDTIVITDDTVAGLHGDKLKDYRVLTFPAGEENKTLDTVAKLAEALLEAGAHRSTTLLGIGGGVVTDIVGFLGSSFMRGLNVVFAPTTLLGQVDAAIGGKNGVNLGLHKNMLGTVRQPRFVLFSTNFLTTLPEDHWRGGFAEIIKYGFIADARILTTLQAADISFFQKHPDKLGELISGCADVKTKIVHADESEEGLRKVLNFGHTAGHAFETLYGLPHGHAIGLGMRVAIKLSEQHAALMPDAGEQLLQLLQQYGLPTQVELSTADVMPLLLTDKKRKEEGIEYVLLEKPGVAVTKVLQPEQIAEALSVVAA
jgi:3-dehydroquinate synthase